MNIAQDYASAYNNKPIMVTRSIVPLDGRSEYTEDQNVYPRPRADNKREDIFCIPLDFGEVNGYIVAIDVHGFMLEIPADSTIEMRG